MTTRVIMNTSRPNGSGGTYKAGVEYDLADDLAELWRGQGICRRTSVRSEQTGAVVSATAGNFPDAPGQSQDLPLTVRNSAQGVEFDPETEAAIAEIAGGGTISANIFGADPDASWEKNRDAFQSANNAAAAAGGGRVTASRGTYLIKGLIQDSRVELYLPGVTLRSPDGQAPNIIEGRTLSTMGTVATDGTAVSVASTVGLESGQAVAIQAVGGILDTQFTTLTTAIDATQTTGLVLSVTTGFETAGVLQCGNELIRYTSRSGGTLVGVTRGAFGTTPASHTTAEYIGVARRLYALVTSVGTDSITIDTPAVLGATGVEVTVGAVSPAISGGVIDGNRPAGGASASTFCVSWPLVRGGSIRNLQVRNADQGGVMLTKGACDSSIVDLKLHDCGIPNISKGAALWLYQGCRRNSIMGVTITGNAWVGIYVDDRTTYAEEGWDAPNDDNTFIATNIRISDSAAAAINVISSNRNKFIGGSIRTPYVCVSIGYNAQGVAATGVHAPAAGNEVSGFSFGALQAWLLDAAGNSLHDCYVTSGTNIVGTNTGNCLIYATSKTPGASPTSDVRAADGAPASPSIGFASDPNTGLYLYGADIIGFSCGGANTMTLYGTELRLSDGVRIATGTTVGSRIGFTAAQKLAFWGGTPAAQPAAISNAVDSTDAVPKLNDLLSKLRSIGIIAT